MSALETLILGIIQGLTEFLPVSSSGHLEIVKAIFGSDYDQKEGLLVTITLHSATAFSTIFVFRKEIALILTDLLQFKKGESFEFSLKILLSMIPSVIIGFFFEDFIASLFKGKIAFVGGMLFITAFLLYFADKVSQNNKEFNYENSFYIGIIQAIAILPGISRSGATIALALLLKIDRDKAARFSFLMVIPLILGGMVKSIADGSLSDENITLFPLMIGFVSAFMTGVFACRWMVALVKKSQLKYFSFYCILVGVLAILLSL